MNNYINMKNKNIHNIIQIPEILSKRTTLSESEVSKCNFEYMTQVSFTQYVLPFFYEAYKKYLKPETSEACIKEMDKYKRKKNLQLELIKNIKDAFNGNGIEYMLIKGIALAQIIYSNVNKRWFNDLDVIIDLADFEKADTIMKQIGFKSVLGDMSIPDISQLECYEIEYDYDLKDITVSVELKIATSSISDHKLISHFKSNKREINISGDQYNTLSLEDTFILLCTNAYSNYEIEFARARIRELFDLYFFMNKYKEELHWNYIVEVADRFKISHKIYALFTLLNGYYDNFISSHIIELFSLEKITYDKQLFHNFDHGWMRDWNISMLDIVLDSRFRLEELFFDLSLKAYSSRNHNFNNKIFVQNIEEKESNYHIDNMLPGLKSDKNQLEYSYGFSHDHNNIFFEINFDTINLDNQMRTVLIIFDLDRTSPRKMIEFYYEAGVFKSRKLTNELEYSKVEASNKGIVISIPKSNFAALANKGRLLCYRFYSVRRFGHRDFAIKDDRETFDFDNPNVLYFNNNNISEVLEDIEKDGLFYVH